MPRVQYLSQIPSSEKAQNLARSEEVRRFVEFKGFRDRYLRVDDFDQDTIDLDFYALAKTAGGNEVDFAIDVTLGADSGAITATTGDVQDNAISLITPIIYKGDRNAGMWVRFKTSSDADMEVEVGFIDAVPGSNASGVTDVDTPTVAMANGALFHVNTGQTLTDFAFVTEGSTANQGIKATTTGIALDDAEYYEATIQLLGDDVVAFFENTATGEFKEIYHNTRATGNSAGYVEGGTALAAWFYVSTLGNATKTMTVDALAIWSDR